LPAQLIELGIEFNSMYYNLP